VNRALSGAEGLPTIAEHIEFSKADARKYLERGAPTLAVLTMLCDLRKHPETTQLAHSMALTGLCSINSLDDARKFVEGF
jgi:hypothetical protein